jgi:hypothetical protein
MPGDETVTCWLRQLEAGDQYAARHLGYPNAGENPRVEVRVAMTIAQQ